MDFKGLLIRVLSYLERCYGGLAMYVTGGDADYKFLADYATYLMDILLFIHYKTVLLLELPHNHPMYYVKLI
uniref:Uncharacterized protein n=1 Tax=Glossina austeni TaxID=7395 RepID=A0A1A9VFM9_GLOAU